MQKRPLGHSGLSVAPLCFGGNVFGWTANEKTSFDILDAFTGAGFDFVDTADVYTRWIEGNKGGESETIIGNWFARSGKRKDVVLATKCGMDMGADGKGLSKTHILKSVEGSLKRLKTDYIDLYQSHADDETVPQEETLAAYDTLIKCGKVRAIGASNFLRQRGWSQPWLLQNKTACPSMPACNPNTTCTTARSLKPSLRASAKNTASA